MKNIVVLLLIILNCSSFANDNYSSVTLSDFARKVSFDSGVNIYIDEEIQKDEVSFYFNGSDSKNLLEQFKISVSKRGFKLKYIDNVYYLTKELEEDIKPFVYTLKNDSFEDIQKYLSMYEGLKFEHLKGSNNLLIFSTNTSKHTILKDLKLLDIYKKQLTLKFTIIEFTDTDIKEIGFKWSNTYKDISKSTAHAIDSILLPFSTQSPFLDKLHFYGALKLLNQKNDFKVLQSPFVLVKHGQNFTFTAGENIPYIEKTTVTEATNKSEENSIIYKDVGLKIEGKSLIFDDYLTLDLDLIVEDIISNNDFMPQTYKRSLTSSTNLQFDKVLLLSGIKKNKIEKNSLEVPFVSNIPYLGEIFKYKYETNTNLNITIAIEVIQDNKNTTMSNLFRVVEHE